MPTTFYARRLITGDQVIDHPVVVTEDGKVVSVLAGEPNGSNETLTASFFDIHVHGACSYDFMAASAAEIEQIGRFLAGRGVAHYLPTTVTASVELTLRTLDDLAEAIACETETQTARPVGIHLEGPFLSHIKRGVHPEPSLQRPSIELFDRFQQAARGNICLMTLAPEVPGALELIEHVRAQGVRVSMGHSNATMTETEAAIAAGASSATHLFNAMRPLDHREPGIVGTVLDSDEVYAELICDGVHVHPALVRLWMKMKGSDRGILVTDGISATGMPDGVYRLGDFDVEVKDGVALLGETLAGSLLTMDQAVANVQRFTGTSLGTAVRLASQNPAKMLGMAHLAETAVGSAANFNIFDEAGSFAGSILNGQRIR
jgi:N-acetylglucosamine-6-phosphate deacetylase